MKEEATKYLKVLELEPGADFQTVKNSYKLLSMAWHPDRFSSEKHKTKAEDKQKKINSAYHWLKNNQEVLSHLNEKTSNRNTKQKSRTSTKAKKQTRRRTSNRKYKSSYNSRVNFDDHLLIFEDKKYDINLIERAILSVESKKYLRFLGYLFYSLSFLFLFLTIASMFGETINTGLTGLILFFIFMIVALVLILIKDVVKINLILKNKSIVTAISYKVFPTTSEAEKKYKIVRSLVDEINDVIGNK
ncbi:MAG: DnaJ domain-containing protein [Psychroflexus maritimus]